MAKYVQTSDGIIHTLPDTVTDANYEIEKQAFLDSYNPTPDPVPTTAPVEQEVNRVFGENSQLKGSFSKEFVELPATYDLLNNAQALTSIEKQINDLNLRDSYIGLTSEEVALRDELIERLKGSGASEEEAQNKALLNNRTMFMLAGQGPAGAFNQAKLLEGLVEEEVGLEKTVEKNLADIKRSKEYQAKVNYSNTFNNLAQAESFGDTLGIIGNATVDGDIFGLIGEILATSSAPMSKSLAAGVGASILGGPIAGAVATGLTSGSVDASHSFLEYLEKKGMDINDRESIVKFMGNKKLVNEAKQYAAIRGTTIGALDGLSFGLASKMLVPKSLVQNIFGRQLLNSLVSQPIVQGTLGGTGELGAQYFTLEEGESLRYGDIAMEVLGEFGFAPAEAALAQMAVGKNYYTERQNIKAEKQLRLTQALDARNKKMFGIKDDDVTVTSGAPTVNRIPIEIGEDLPTFTEAFEIYEDFTDGGANPEKFPSRIIYRPDEYSNEQENTNVFVVKQNEDQTFSIVDFQGNPIINPKTGEVYPSYKTASKAGGVAASLNAISFTRFGIERTEEYSLMQNLDMENPTIRQFGEIVSNPYYDGINIEELRQLNVSPNVIKLITDATGSQENVAISQLKNILSKSQFDKVMTARSNNLLLDETAAPKSVSAATLKKLLKNKNIENNLDSPAFQRFALQFTGESNVDNMSIAQRRVLYSVIDRISTSPELITLPDFTHRPYKFSTYQQVVEDMERTGDTSLDFISNSSYKTTYAREELSKEESKRLREDLVTAGYVEEKYGRYKWIGTYNQKVKPVGVKAVNRQKDSDELQRRKLSAVIDQSNYVEKLKAEQEIDKRLDQLKKDFKKINPNGSLSFDQFIEDVKGNRINVLNDQEVEGIYDPLYDKILVPMDRAGQDFKNDPDKFIKNLARILNHETFHSLFQNDLLTQEEKNTLANYVYRTKAKKSTQEIESLKQELEDGILSQEQFNEIIEETYYEQSVRQNVIEASEGKKVKDDATVVEEAMARAFENMEDSSGKPQNIFNKIKTFFGKLNNALNENGFQNATDIFNRIESGEIGGRQRGEVRTTLELDRIQSRFDYIVNTAKAAGVDTDDIENSFNERLPDSPELKFSLNKSKASPLTREFLFGLKHNQFTDQMDVFTNVSENKDEILSNFLTKRRKQDLNNPKELRNFMSVTGALSQIALQTDIQKGLIEVNPDNTTPMYLVGDVSRSRFTTMHRNKADAIRTAQLRGHLYYTPLGNKTKVTTVNVPLRAIGFHPRIYNAGDATMSNPYNKQGEQLFGIESSSIPLNKVSEENIEPLIGQAPRTKFSLKRTAGRLDNPTIQELMEQSNYNNLETYVNASDNLLPFLIEISKKQGSDFIAAILENDFNFINDSYYDEMLNYGVENSETINNAQEIIKEITDASLENFPEYIVVYRGGNIKDQYNVIPVTTNKEAANIFASQYVGTAKDRVDPQPVVVQEFLIPKSKVLANMNALMIPKSQINFSPIQNQTSSQEYSYADEMELLVNREDLEISGIDRVPEIEVKKIHERIQKEKSKGEENTREFIQQELLGLGGLNEPILRTMDDREFANEQNKLKQLINDIDLSSINQEQLLELLNHPSLVEAEQRMFSIPIYEEEIQTQTVLDLINKANSYAGNTVEQGKKATFLLGLPASGKSFFAEQLATEQQAAIIDSDDAKRILPGFGSGLGANSVAPMSSEYSNIVLKTLSDNGSNIIIPSVGSSRKYQSIEKKIKMLQDKGYEVSVGLIDTDFNHALIRMLNRFVDSGRLIATDYFVDVDNTPRDTYNELKRTGLVTNFAFLNNNFAQGQQTVEEDNTQLFRQFGSPRQIGIGDVRQSYAERTRLSEAIEQAVEEANQEKQKSLDAGATPVINTAVNPESIYSAVEARKLIRNTPAENSADINSIINDLDTNLQLKYSVKNTRKKLIPEAERLMDRMTNRQSRPDDNLTIGQKLFSVFKGFPSAQQFREGIIDQYSRAAETDYIAGKESDIGNKMLSASVSAAAALYHSDRSGDIFQQAWLRGVPVYDKEKGYTTVKSEIDGQVIVAPQQIFKEAYKNSSLLDAFQAVLRVKRETRFNQEGRKTKITAQDKKDAEILLKKYPEVETMVEQYQLWNSYLVQFLVDTGVLNKKTAEIWLANSDYIPFYRDMEGQEGFKGPKIFQGLQITPFKEAKGSETLDIVDPITGITNNLRAAINAGMKNVASNRVMRNLVIMGVAKQVKGTPGFSPPIGHVRIKVDGETKTFKVDDPDYFNAFTIQTGNMGPEGFLASSLGAILRPTKQAISELITRMPDFWFRQILRDSISAWGLSGANYAPVLASIKESISIAVGMARGKLPPEYEALRNAGVIAGYDKNVRDIDSTESLIKNLYKDEMKSRRSTIEKVYMAPFDAIVKMWDILGQGTAITDASTRVAVYKDTLKRTGDEAEAISQAMEVLNFTRRGNDPMFQFASQTIMFLNPRLQGLDVFYRGLTGKYGIGRGLSKSQRATAVAIRMIGMMSLMPWYYLAVRDTDEYKEAPEEIKDNYIIFPRLSRLVGSLVALPKPFEVGLLAMTIPERLMAYMLDDDPAKDFGDSLVRNISHTFAISPPTAIAPLVENFFNYDLYTGRPIVPPYMKGQDDLAFRPSTSSLARKLGDATDTSPLYWDNIIRDYTGSMGTYAMLAVDSVLRDSSRGDRPSLRVDQLPVIGTFLLNPEGSGLENEFFELKKMTDDLVESFRVLENHYDTGDRSVMKMTDEYKIQYQDAVKKLQSDLLPLADKMKQAREYETYIINHPTLSADDKRDKLNSIRRTKNIILESEKISEQRFKFIDDYRKRAISR